MQSARLGAGLSRSMRQSAVGFVFIGSVALFIGLLLWLQNLTPGRRSYRAFVEFSDAGGMGPGTAVAYRGVKVGRVVDIEPRPQGVNIEIEISRADRRIPSNSVIEANQSGLIGETSINITPLESLPVGEEVAGPLDPACNPDIIICNGSQLQGEAQLDVKELIRSTLRIANLLSDPQFTANINSVAQNASDALSAISTLSGDVSDLTNEVEQLVAGGSVEATLTSVSQAADEVQLLAATNRTTLANTLVSFQQSSDRLRTTLDELAPVINQGNLTEIIDNLETLSVNAAEASVNLRDFSTSINDPANGLMLQQLLDSARSTFQNVQKITSDLDELTGDPAFRSNIRDLIDGLNRLISMSEQLEQQAQVAQALDSLTTVIENPHLDRVAPDSTSSSTSSRFPSVPREEVTEPATFPNSRQEARSETGSEAGSEADSNPTSSLTAPVNSTSDTTEPSATSGIDRSAETIRSTRGHRSTETLSTE